MRTGGRAEGNGDQALGLGYGGVFCGGGGTPLWAWEAAGGGKGGKARERGGRPGFGSLPAAGSGFQVPLRGFWPQTSMADWKV
jgi:hypothetical protein